MPVRKFRSVDEMNQPVWRRPGDPELYRTIKAVWERSLAMNPRRFPPGVYKFRSIEEMNHAQEQALDEHVAALRKQRAT